MKWCGWILTTVFNLVKSWLTALSHGSHFVTFRPSWVAPRNDNTFFSRFLRSLLPLPLAGPSSFPRNHTAKRQVQHHDASMKRNSSQSVMPESETTIKECLGGHTMGPFEGSVGGSRILQPSKDSFGLLSHLWYRPLRHLVEESQPFVYSPWRASHPV